MAAVAEIAEKTTIASNEEQLVTMIVDRQLFGIPILQVQDIVEATNITPVPLSTSAIAGMLNLRGRIVTVIDLRKLLGNDEEVPWESQMGVTVEFKGDLYTLLVDSIGDVRSVRRSDFDKAPSTLEPETRRLCSGIYRLQGNLLVVLEVSRIMTTDVIGATTVLTVAERKARKAAALENAKGKEDGGRQLSMQMTGLSGYEGDAESATEAESLDDIKQRKKENRNRRPVAERWRDAMTERAKRTGHSIYRLQEPDDETLEAAREKMAKEDADWQVRMGGGEAPAEGVSDEPAGDLAALPDEAYSGEAFSDMPAPDEPESTDEPSLDFSDEPASTDSLSADMTSDEPVSDQSFAGDEFAAPDFAEMPAEDAAPLADEASQPAVDDLAAADEGDMPARDLTPADPESATADDADMKTEEPAADETPEPTDDMAAMTEFPEDGAAAEPVMDEATDPAVDEAADPAVDDAETAGESEDTDKAGVLSGFWNRLRGPEKTATDEPETSGEAAAFDDMPSADELPAFDEDLNSGDEPAAEDEPKKAKKSRAKAKPAAGKKTPAKRKSTKSDKS